MISGVHALIYSRDAGADRRFLRDVLGLKYVNAHEDPSSSEDWLIFALPPAEVGVHPTGGAPMHELHLMCDDVAATVAELTAKGVEFTGPVTDAGYGLVTAIRLPGGGEIGLYQPTHEVALGLND